MATRAPTITDLPYGRLVSWSGLLNGDDGAPYEGMEYGDRCLQVGGTFGVGGSVSLQGGNNGAQWDALTDPQGNALTATAVKIEQVLENPRYFRPLVTAGDGTTSLTATLLCRRTIR